MYYVLEINKLCITQFRVPSNEGLLLFFLHRRLTFAVLREIMFRKCYVISGHPYPNLIPKWAVTEP